MSFSCIRAFDEGSGVGLRIRGGAFRLCLEEVLELHDRSISIEDIDDSSLVGGGDSDGDGLRTVSYTHLTLADERPRV